VWTYTSAPQAPGYHNYWMTVDGAIVLDPATQAFIGYGHMCNGFEFPEPGVDFYDIKDVPHGNVLIKNYFAKTTNSWRHIFVYTPPGYEAATKTRYPVFYLQHGGGEDERVWIEMGRTNVILDNLLAAGKVKPMIVGDGNQRRGWPGRSRPWRWRSCHNRCSRRSWRRSRRWRGPRTRGSESAVLEAAPTGSSWSMS